MDLNALLLFIPASFALNMVPGPNNLLSMHNGQRFGFMYALGAGLGRLLAFSLMILLVATGLSTLLYASEAVFFSIKIIGAMYLFWIAYQLWTSDVSNVGSQKIEHKTIYKLAKQEFLLAIGNPKAILIFTAFLPQFVDISKDSSSQFLTLGVIFLFLEILAVFLYASFGIYLRTWFSKPTMRRLFNRGCALFIGTIGIGLITERRV